jgi:hypothetical protein
LARELSEVRAELRDYLERLGLHVEEGKGGSLLATRRTALAQESLEFRVVEKLPARLPRNVRFILPPSSKERKVDGQAFPLDAFLDSTIQADRLAQELVDDPEIAEERAAFVPQRVAEGGQPNPDNAVEFLANWFQNRRERLLVVLAPAGYGKTLLTRVFAHRLANAHLADPGNPLPFLLPFAQFRRVAEFEGMILSAIQRKGITDFTAAAFAYLVQKQRCVLMLDGFDELLEERPDEAQKNLRELIETLSGQGRIVVTARSTFFRTSTEVADFLEHYLSDEDVTVLDLQPFDAGQRRELVQRLAPNQTIINAINKILETEGLSEAMGSPLLLRETVEALAHPGEGRRRLPPRAQRKDIFDVLEPSVYARERERHGHKFPDRVQRRFVELLAREMLSANVRGFEMEGVQVLATEAAEEFNFVSSPSDLARLADHHFVTVDRSSDEVRFNHQVFREYFQASALAAAARAGEAEWIVSVLAARPLPEEVAAFVAELERPAFSTTLLDCVSPIVHGANYLSRNVASICAAFRTRDAINSLLRAIDGSVPLGFRIAGIDLSGTDWADRILDGMEFVNCDLSEARFDGATIRDIAFQNCNLGHASFANAVPDSVQFDYGSRIFGTTAVIEALRDRGVSGMEEEGESLEDLELEWRDWVKGLLASRMRRFYVAGVEGSKGSKWDRSILEMNLLGGLDQFERRYASSELIPELVKTGVLTRVREHGNVVYRLNGEAMDDARRLIEDDEASGLMDDVLERLSAS